MAAKKDKVGNVPNLRFNGFEGEWEQRILSDLGNFIGGGTPSSSNSDFWNGDIPWVSSSDLEEGNIHSINVSRFITEEAIKKSSTKFCKAPIILIVSRVGVGKVAYSNESICTSQDFTNIVNFECNGLFLSYFLSVEMKNSASSMQGTSIKGISSTEIKSKKLFIPNDNEQQRIASFLSLVDERIMTQSKIIEEFKSLKDILTKKIFSHKLKFKNINGSQFTDWKCLSLGEVTMLVNNRNKKNEKLPVYSINNKIGFTPQGDQFDGIDSNARGYDIKIYKIIDKATFAYNPARINVGSIGYSGELDKIIISSLYVCFKTKEEVDDNFLLQYLKTDMFNKQVLENMEGGVRSYLFYENFSRITLDLPNLQEQRTIADFLGSLDNKIELEIAFADKLKEQKQYLLSNLFI